MGRMTSQEPQSFGRADADGTVHVRTSDGERTVGQVPDATPEEAMAFYTRRYAALETQVQLLADRIRSGRISPDEARKSIKTEREAILTANAVGDLEGLAARLDALTPLLKEQAQARKQAKAEQNEQTKHAKEEMVGQAEKIAAGNDWRGGVNKFRDLLEKWKALPRIDKATDDELWHRFSSARTTYTRRRKAQFAQQAEDREGARKTKEAIIAEAETLAGSTEWGDTARSFRDLMQRWKAAGPAPREVDDKLWAKFRGLQDQFFDARNAAMAEQDEQFRGNQAAKEELLDKAEAEVLPVKDLERSKAAYRRFLDAWAELGKVPRDAIKPLDNRVRALEKGIKEAEDEQWRRTDPEARERAEGTASMLNAQIAKLEKDLASYESRGDDKRAKEARASIETYRSWVDQAEKAAAEFSG
ncbi:DNA repair protein [Parenemella sanctibonifatiensis]|uniref:DNA repair protein n=2 Tax=Parenemella sanctibonifatiensis TaxID=2016505 RepID=A0A255E5H2_9ACTN|nr:DNA repair protein [Parenemella sanctibonifatiensis]